MSFSFPPPPPPIHPPAASFMEVIKSGYRDWKKYSARSSRREFWLWILHASLIFLVLGLLIAPLPAESLAASLLSYLFLIPLLPSLSMWVRRIHDTGHRIWWCFFPIGGGLINLIFLCSATNVAETWWSRTTSS